MTGLRQDIESGVEAHFRKRKQVVSNGETDRTLDGGYLTESHALVDALETLSEENVDTDLWAFLRWMIQGIGGKWKVDDLDATGRLYQLPFLSG